MQQPSEDDMKAAQAKAERMTREHGDRGFKKHMENPMTRILYDMVQDADKPPQQLAALIRASFDAGMQVGMGIVYSQVSNGVMSVIVGELRKDDGHEG